MCLNERIASREAWREQYRRARLVRGFGDAVRGRQPHREVFLLSIEWAVPVVAYRAAGRVYGDVARFDPLTRPLWLRKAMKAATAG